MNVLHVLDHSAPLLSGYSFRTAGILHAQRARGLRPVVLTSPKQGPTDRSLEVVDGIPHHRTPVSRDGRVGRAPFVRELRLMARLARRISEVARAERTDVLHAHSPLLNGLPALLAGRRLGVPVVYEARAFWEDAAVDHGTFAERSARYRISRALETLLFRRADAVVTICEGMRTELVRRGVAESRIVVVPNGVDVDRFQPMPRSAETAARLGLDGGPVFGFIGSFYHYEGLRFLVEAFGDVVRRLPGARLLLVGGGGEEREIQALAHGAPAVVFAGRVPHDTVRRYYSVIDVFVCPRRRMRLTELVTPLKPLEAMAMERTVLASDLAALRELIRHDTTGLLFCPERREEFTAQAVRAGCDRDLRAALGSAARADVARDRTWERIVSRYVSLYKGLV